MKKSENYLEFVPIPRRGLHYEVVDGAVTIFRENTGLFNRLAQKFWHRPKITRIQLDEMGNFIWPLMDGTRDISAIADRIKETYGEQAEPLYNRAVQYFKILSDYGFIEFAAADRD